MSTELKISRRERNKLRNREEILEAALEEFSDKGYHDASIQDIAVRAEFAVGTIYALFGTKEGLYRELLIEYAQEATIALTAALDEGVDEYEQLQNYVKAKGRLFENRIKLTRLIFTETLGTGIAFKASPNPELKKMYDIWHFRLAEVFEAGIAKGVFRDSDPFALAVALEGLTNAFTYQCQERPEEYGFDKTIECIEDIFFRSILKSY